MTVVSVTPKPPSGVSVTRSGPSGKSAYQIALDNGFSGTVEAWLASLVGETGDTGPMPDHDWDGTQIRFQKSDGTWDVYVDLIGPSPEHAWSGTQLRFKQPTGTWGNYVDLKGAAGDPGVDGDDGDDGWTPVEATVTDGDRRVKQIVDWVGGTGTKPATGKYIGSTGLVDDIGDAVDVRGPAGADGEGSGDVSGPSSATDGHIALFDGATGKLIKDGGAPFSGSYNDLDDLPTLGSAAAKDTTFFAAASHTHTLSQISDASANGRSLVSAENYAAMRTLLGLVIGTDVQAYDADTAKTDAAQTWTGAQLFGQIGTSVSALGSGSTINCSANNAFSRTISGNVTFSFSNVPSSRSFGVSLVLTYSSGTVTWPSSVKWKDDTAPTLTAGKTYVVVLHTINGGTTWRGAAMEFAG